MNNLNVKGNTVDLKVAGNTKPLAEESNTQALKEEHINVPPLPFGNSSLGMTPIYNTKNGTCLMGTWSKDVGTKEMSLKLTQISLDGEVSQIYEFPKSKLVSEIALRPLTNLDGVNFSDLSAIFARISLIKKVAVQEDRSGKCSLKFAYQSLCEYVEQYEEPGKVFSASGFGNILRSYLPAVLDKLDLGYTALELSKEFKVWSLLRVNHGTGHPYSYKINAWGRNDWYFSFKLPSANGEREEVAA